MRINDRSPSPLSQQTSRQDTPSLDKPRPAPEQGPSAPSALTRSLTQDGFEVRAGSTRPMPRQDDAFLVAQARTGEAGAPQVLTTWNSGGRPVRERVREGGQVHENVIAYDASGRAHRFRDALVTTLPISSERFAEAIPAWRRQQLDGTIEGLVSRYRREPEKQGERPVMDYRDLGNMLTELASWKNMTNMEKAYVWSGVEELRRGTREGPRFRVINDYVPNNVIDSHPGRAENSVNHILVSFTDRYHARMGGLSEADARAEIVRHESTVRGVRMPFNLNPGDTEASLRTVEAFRAFRTEGFEAFARTWVNNFVTSEK